MILKENRLPLLNRTDDTKDGNDMNVDNNEPSLNSSDPMPIQKNGESLKDVFVKFNTMFISKFESLDNVLQKLDKRIGKNNAALKDNQDALTEGVDEMNKNLSSLFGQDDKKKNDGILGDFIKSFAASPIGIALTAIAAGIAVKEIFGVTSWEDVITKFTRLNTKSVGGVPVGKMLSSAGGPGWAGIGIVSQTTKDIRNLLGYDNATPGLASGVSASKIQGKREIQIKDATGALIESRRGGDPNWRNNNLGNIEYGSFAKEHGAIGSDGRWAIFPSYEAGFKAADALMKDKQRGYRNLSIAQATHKWTPKSEAGNDPEAHIQAFRKAGIDTSKKYIELEPEQQRKFLEVKYKLEGSKQGDTTLYKSPSATNQPQINKEDKKKQWWEQYSNKTSDINRKPEVVGPISYNNFEKTAQEDLLNSRQQQQQIIQPSSQIASIDNSSTNFITKHDPVVKDETYHRLISMTGSYDAFRV